MDVSSVQDPFDLEENETQTEEFERRFDNFEDDIAFASFTTALGEMRIRDIGEEFGKHQSALVEVQKRRSEVRRELYLVEQLKATAEGQLLEAVKADLAKAKGKSEVDDSSDAKEDPAPFVAPSVPPEPEVPDRVESSLVVSLLQDLEETLDKRDLHTGRLQGKIAMLSKRCERAEETNHRLLRERERLLKALKIATSEQTTLRATQESTENREGYASSGRIGELDDDELPHDLAKRLQKLRREVQRAKRATDLNKSRPGKALTLTRTVKARSIVSTDSSDDADSSILTNGSRRSLRTAMTNRTTSDSGSEDYTPSTRSTCSMRIQSGSAASLATWDTVSTASIFGDSTRSEADSMRAVRSESGPHLPLSSSERGRQSRLVWGVDGDWRWEEVGPHWRREERTEPVASRLEDRSPTRTSPPVQRQGSSGWESASGSSSSGENRTQSPRSSAQELIWCDDGEDSERQPDDSGTESSTTAGLTRSQAFRKALLRKRTRTLARESCRDPFSLGTESTEWNSEDVAIRKIRAALARA